MAAWQKIVSLAIVVLAVGCGSPSHLARFVDINTTEWCTPINVRFSVEPRDTMEMLSLQLHARYNKDINSDKLEMMLSITAPDGVEWSEPYTLHLAATNKLQQLASATYRERVEWRQCGEYTINISPLHVYRGVSSIGVELLNTK